MQGAPLMGSAEMCHLDVFHGGGPLEGVTRSVCPEGILKGVPLTVSFDGGPENGVH
jgi:hypothetical protein